ncbi:uncharacterized protein SAPINGB_P004261 [Magnusiomyces paraingens]|uniref:Uncharacterized protein n=1 Tax=Magnusiomyces paraingens TaxID=2606893 RepID=A0A5E8C100_9ASCO|nr:uncharacterized protein SAPINGB_P004261 [Saprochaete ingens]VVT54785.1 unnamed protein product [Saprochaete ingens]
MVLTGRGGFGNFSSSSSAQSPVLEPSQPPPVQSFKSASQPVSTGRGGYGNTIPISKISTLTPNEYLAELQRSVDATPATVSVGRGGSGNIRPPTDTTEGRHTNASISPILAPGSSPRHAPASSPLVPVQSNSSHLSTSSLKPLDG